MPKGFIVVHPLGSHGQRIKIENILSYGSDKEGAFIVVRDKCIAKNHDIIGSSFLFETPEQIDALIEKAQEAANG